MLPSLSFPLGVVTLGLSMNTDGPASRAANDSLLLQTTSKCVCHSLGYSRPSDNTTFVTIESLLNDAVLVRYLVHGTDMVACIDEAPQVSILQLPDYHS